MVGYFDRKNTPHPSCSSCCTPNAMITLKMGDDIFNVAYNILGSVLSGMYLENFGTKICYTYKVKFYCNTQ
jgi:hypothetical protein